MIHKGTSYCENLGGERDFFEALELYGGSSLVGLGTSLAINFAELRTEGIGTATAGVALIGLAGISRYLHRGGNQTDMQTEADNNHLL